MWVTFEDQLGFSFVAIDEITHFVVSVSSFLGIKGVFGLMFLNLRPIIMFVLTNSAFNYLIVYSQIISFVPYANNSNYLPFFNHNIGRHCVLTFLLLHFF